MARRKVLQVFKDDKWRYVFSRNSSTGGINTTLRRDRAIPGRHTGTALDAKEYFESHFANHQFRIEE